MHGRFRNRPYSVGSLLDARVLMKRGRFLCPQDGRDLTMNENEFEQPVEAGKPDEKADPFNPFDPPDPNEIVKLHVDLKGAEHSDDIKCRITNDRDEEFERCLCGLGIDIQPNQPIVIEAAMWGKARGEFTIKSLSAYTMEELHAEIARRA